MRGSRVMRMRGSVFTYLVCLSMLPLVGLGAFAMMLVERAESEQRVAERLESAMERVTRADRLRVALGAEATAAVITGIAASADVSFDDLAQLLNESVVPLDRARAETDAAIAGLSGDPLVGLDVATLAQERADFLRPLDSLDTSRSTGSTDSVVVTGEGTALVKSAWDLLSRAGSIEITAGEALVSGRYGQADVALSTAAGQITAATTLVVQASERASVYFLFANAPAGTDREAGIEALRAADASYRAVHDGMERSLRGQTAVHLRALTTSKTARHVDSLVQGLLRGGQSGSAPAAGGGAQFDPAVQTLLSDLNGVVATAVGEGRAAAAAERATAAANARKVAVSTAGLVLVTLLLLVLIGGAVRHRLNLLAGAARRLSSGRLGTVQIRGPRELEQAGQGLNDAARSLGRVLAGAERLAAGDLTAAELRTPLEGRLGAAISAAFRQVTEAIEERERLQRELAHAASHDPLTGLPNRSAVEGLLDRVLRDSRATGVEAALLFIDLDHFKAVNDSHGHAAGDHVLKVAAERMAAQVRVGDTLCRLGGDEFVVVISGGRPESSAVGARIVAAFSEPIVWTNQLLRIGASVGIAVFDPRHDVDVTGDDLLIQADQAVYRAKAEGRGTVRT